MGCKTGTKAEYRYFPKRGVTRKSQVTAHNFGREVERERLPFSVVRCSLTRSAWYSAPCRESQMNRAAARVACLFRTIHNRSSLPFEPLAPEKWDRRSCDLFLKVGLLNDPKPGPVGRCNAV